METEKDKLNGLDLFSGIGGITLGLSEWVRPIAYCEIERYTQGVLLSRMAEGSLPKAPIWEDIKTLKGSMLPIQPDIIYGGFPCQDISTAGLGAGLEGERSGLFFEIVRLAKETKSPFIFLENVPAIRTRGLRGVIRTLTDLGYDCRWTRISAAELDAPHIRYRWFLLAYSNKHDDRKKKRHCSDEKIRVQEKDRKKNCSSRESRRASNNEQLNPHHRHEDVKTMAHPNGKNVWDKQGRSSRQSGEGKTVIGDSYWKKNQSPIRTVDDGIPFRMDQLKALGNAVVPAQVEEAFKRLIGK